MWRRQNVLLRERRTDSGNGKGCLAARKQIQTSTLIAHFMISFSLSHAHTHTKTHTRRLRQRVSCLVVLRGQRPSPRSLPVLLTGQPLSRDHRLTHRHAGCASLPPHLSPSSSSCPFLMLSSSPSLVPCTLLFLPSCHNNPTKLSPVSEECSSSPPPPSSYFTQLKKPSLQLRESLFGL